MLVAMGVGSTAAQADPLTPLNDQVDLKEVPAFASGNKHGIVTDSITIDGNGKYSVVADLDSGEFTITNPDGTVTTTNGNDVAAQAQSFLERGVSEGKIVGSISAEPGGYQTMGLKEDVCPYLVGAIGAGHQAAWRAALSLVTVNVAIAAVVSLGYWAFWIWVSTNCP